MRRFIWSRRARRDLDAIRNYLLQHDPDYWSDLLTSSRAAVRFLVETPGAGSPVEKSTMRKWRVGKTPYLLLYRFDRRELTILRVWHERQDWK